MTTIRGSAAAVTGAASGIGRALALELAARGCDLALADRDEAGAQATAREVRRPGAHKGGGRHPTPAESARAGAKKDTLPRVDVGEPQQIADFARAATLAHPGL